MKYEEDPALTDEFRRLIVSVYTFVDDWSSPEITPNTYRLYGKKNPPKNSVREYITQVKANLNHDEIRFSNLNDVQNPQNSRQEWHAASE